MRFTAEHRFAASPAAVAALLVDPDFMTGVALPDLSLPTVVTHTDGDDARLRLRYEYVGSLDPIAKRVIGAHRLVLIQDLRLDRRAGRGELTFAAESAPEKLRALATVEVVATGTGSVRTLRGEFSVRIPVVGGTAERRILPGVLRRLDAEARAVSARLEAGERRS